MAHGSARISEPVTDHGGLLASTRNSQVGCKPESTDAGSDWLAHEDGGKIANVASLHEIGHEVTKSSWALPVTSRQDMNANQASNVNGVSCRDHCMGAPKPSSGYMVASSRFNNQ